MFYLELENQIHLLIILIFSSYIYISSLLLKQDNAFTKHIGTAFFIPFVLCILSFLSINTALSSSYLFFSEFILITAILFILVVQKNNDFTHFVVILLYMLPLGIIILNLNLEPLYHSSVFHVILIFYLGVVSISLLAQFLLKRHSHMLIYTAVLTLTGSLVMARITAPFALILKVIGYILFLSFFIRSTIRKLEESHSRNSAQLNRINQSLQREVNRRVEEIERSNQKLLEISKTDSLTGILTKKAIVDQIDTQIQKNSKREFSILMFDIDHFKKINDSHGHIVGDKCIKNLVSIARNSLRGDDHIGRYGGDEFVILLPDTNTVKAYLAAERFRKNVEKTNNPHYTISVGIATFPLNASNTRGLISEADKALYISKAKGRNRVTYAGQKDED